jgi:hypothetical protein
MKNKIVLTSYTILSEDGVFLRAEENPERDQIVISLTRDGKVETARLNYDQWEALHELRYKLECKRTDLQIDEVKGEG